MREIVGDLWKVECEYRCVTTNGVVSRCGELVMGKGVALQARKLFPHLPAKLGSYLKTYGNRPFILPNERIITFPTKHDWRDKSDISLIERSAKLIKLICDNRGIGSVALTRPGCGNGGLGWEEVKPVIQPYLDERFLVVSTD